MKVEQIYEIVNSLTQQYIGESQVVETDLSNVVDIGKSVMDLSRLDNYVRSLVDHIGKVVFVNRAYRGKTPSLYMDGWEYGAILEKITYDGLPEAQKNDSWDLQDGVSYDPNIFYKPTVSAKFFNSKNTFDIPMSFAERQVKSAFSSRTQLNAFFSMIENTIQKSMTVKMDQMSEQAINNMIALTIKSNNANRAVNLLSRYNTQYKKSLTAADAIYDADFVRYAAYVMGLYKERLQRLSQLFNEGGKERFTAGDKLHTILLSEFNEAAGVYLYSDTWHNEYVKLPKAETVPYWQGSGTGYDFASTSSINIIPNTGAATETAVSKSGILGVMFDREALGIFNLDQRVTTNYNGRAEFYNNWYKFDAGYFNDPNENFIVFYVA